MSAVISPPIPNHAAVTHPMQLLIIEDDSVMGKALNQGLTEAGIIAAGSRMVAKRWRSFKQRPTMSC